MRRLDLRRTCQRRNWPLKSRPTRGEDGGRPSYAKPVEVPAFVAGGSFHPSYFVRLFVQLPEPRLLGSTEGE